MMHITRYNLKKLLSNLRNSAKRRGIEFDLDLVDLNELSFPLTCPILGIELGFFDKVCDNSYSIDRIDNNLGYIVGNIIVISFRANRIKNDSNSIELKKISNFYRDLL